LKFLKAFLTAALLSTSSAALAATAASPSFQTFSVQVWPPIPGSAINNNSKSGNTDIFATVNGALVATHCVIIDANDNLIDSGNRCILGGSATTGQLAIFSSSQTISGFNIGNNVANAIQNPTNANGGIVTFPVTAADLASGAAISNLGFTPLSVANNLSDVPNISLARTNLGAAASGTNSDITSLTNLTTPLSQSEGGTGTTTPSLQAGSHVTITGPWPNQTVAMTPGTAGLTPAGSIGQIQFNLDGTDLGGFTLGGDCSLSIPNITCTSSNGVAFGNIIGVNVGTPTATALAGTINTPGGLVTDPVTNNTLSTMAVGTIKSNISSSVATPSDNTLSAIIDNATSTTQGSVLFRSNTGWVSLLPGTVGQYLRTGGASANPTWSSSGLAPATFALNTVLGNFTHTAGAVATAVPAPVGFRNRIINGDMNISQRFLTQTIAAGVGQYTLDRWLVTGGNATIQQVAASSNFSGSLSTFANAMSITGGGVPVVISQRIQAANAASLSGEPVALQATISCLNLTTVAWSVVPASSPDNFSSLGSGVSGTFSVPPESVFTTEITTFSPTFSFANGVQLNFSFPIGTSCEITGVQMEPGSSITPFEQLPLDVEMSRCQYYFQKSFDEAINSVNGSSHIYFLTGLAAGSHTAGETIGFSTPMRSTPTITLIASDGTSGEITDFSNGSADISPGSVTANSHNFFWDATTSTSSAVELNFQFNWEANAEL
jgi:hypothetical protein